MLNYPPRYHSCLRDEDWWFGNWKRRDEEAKQILSADDEDAINAIDDYWRVAVVNRDSDGEVQKAMGRLVVT
jgi:hypothetical protein